MKPSSPGPDPIDLTPSQRAMIEGKIAELIEDSTSIHAYAIGAVVRTHALPLYFDWSAFMGLRPEGQIIWVPYDDESGGYEIVREERILNLGLCQGAKRYPDLSFLRPSKPPDAVVCSHCRGEGRLAFPRGHEHLSEMIICYCGGLGWLPRDRKP